MKLFFFSYVNNLVHNIVYLSKHKLWQQREDDIVFLSKKIVDDIGFEYNLIKHPIIKVLNKEKSFELLKTTKKSFIRFGDGEINLMKGYNQPFQRYDKILANSLIEQLKNKNDDIYICVNYSYFSPLGNIYSEYSDFERRYSYSFRKFLYQHCTPKSIYLDGAVTFWHKLGEYTENSSVFWNQWKEFFRNEKIAIICGRGVIDKLKYDVFEYAKEKKFIYGPNKNAWSERNIIIEDILSQVSKDWKLVFILGMAGKAIIPCMVEQGYIAWDIGHLAKGYDLYMKKVKVDMNIVRDFFKPD